MVVWVVVPSYVLGRLLRRLHLRASTYPVPEELRGWSWDRPPVRPRAYLGLGVYEVASYCPTKRDVWLRRVAEEVPKGNDSLKLGSDTHSVIASIASAIRSRAVLGDLLNCGTGVVEEVLKGFKDREWYPVLREVAYIAYHTMMSDYVWASYGEGYQPFLGWLSEVRVDGTPLGLSPNLRVDAVVSGNLVLDFKVGKRAYNHEVGLAGYAMAVEANLEVPIDYGFIVYISPNGHARVSVRGVHLGPDLRRDFIDSRDEVIDMVLSEREPPKALNCPQACPFRHVCGG